MPYNFKGEKTHWSFAGNQIRFARLCTLRSSGWKDEPQLNTSASQMIQQKPGRNEESPSSRKGNCGNPCDGTLMPCLAWRKHVNDMNGWSAAISRMSSELFSLSENGTEKLRTQMMLQFTSYMLSCGMWLARRVLRSYGKFEVRTASKSTDSRFKITLLQQEPSSFTAFPEACAWSANPNEQVPRMRSIMNKQSENKPTKRSMFSANHYKKCQEMSYLHYLSL